MEKQLLIIFGLFYFTTLLTVCLIAMNKIKNYLSADSIMAFLFIIASAPIGYFFFLLIQKKFMPEMQIVSQDLSSWIISIVVESLFLFTGLKFRR
jgi:hypothetical protein